ncbi:MAG: tail fiber domain-containing protein [Vicinamibacterales bacterium]
MTRARIVFAALLTVAVAGLAGAQPLGSFRWQLQPYCNVVTMNVTGVAGVYTLEGFDDQCGAPTRAPLTGVATPNPDGTIGFGFTIVASPGGRGVQVEARLSMAGLGGPWSDSDGHTGTLAFNRSIGGSPRPSPVAGPVIPSVFHLRTDGGFVAGGSATVGTIPASGPGRRLMWHPRKAAFRVGETVSARWDDAQVGEHSAAFGYETAAHGAGSIAAGTTSVAHGASSVAMGFASVAQGEASVAIGQRAMATGSASVALGDQAEAAGTAGTALGYRSAANGFGSVAAGYHAVATREGSVALGGSSALAVGTLADGIGAVALGTGHSAAGQFSTTLGTFASTSPGAAGSFVYGDRSTPNTVQSFSPNEFVVRAAGGTYLYSNAALNAGVKLAPGASAWSALSDANSKENFRDLDGAAVLARLARMPIREWNYKAQSAGVRHVGPTAQDFHAAFGLGEDPLRISTIDADGIALVAVQALTRENDTLKAALAALLARVERLEAQR